MSQHHASVHVADGVDARHVGCHVVVNSNAAARIVGNACRFEVQPVDIRLATSGNKHHVGFNAFLFAFALVGDAAVANGFNSSLHDEVDASFFEHFACTLGNVGVDCRQTFLEEFNHGDFHAITVEN